MERGCVFIENLIENTAVRPQGEQDKIFTQDLYFF